MLETVHLDLMAWLVYQHFLRHIRCTQRTQLLHDYHYDSHGFAIQFT